MVEANRPTTDADAVIFQNANTKKNSDDLLNWIKDNSIARNQIISITSNENDIEDGDQVTTLFYRKASIVTGALPVDNIQLNNFNNQQSWERQQSAANSFKGGNEYMPDIIAISRTPKNIGNARL